MSHPLSENGKVIGMMLLIPLFWPFLPLMLIFMACEAIREAYYARKFRDVRNARDEAEKGDA